MTKLEERRADLERKILNVFQVAQEMPRTCEKGIGKNSIKRMLEAKDETLRVSINTIKRRVDEMLAAGVIVCVNPHAVSDVRFRLAGYYCDHCDSDIFPVYGHCPNCKSDLTEFITMVK